MDDSIIFGEKLIKEVSYDITLTIAYLSSPKEKITYKFWAKDEEKSKVLDSANIKTNEFLELINTCDMVINNSDNLVKKINYISYSMVLNVMFEQHSLQKMVLKKNCRHTNKDVVMDSAKKHSKDLINLLINL